MSDFIYIHYNDDGDLVIGEDESIHVTFDAADAIIHHGDFATKSWDTSDLWGKYEYKLHDSGVKVMEDGETSFTNGSSSSTYHPENSGANNNGPNVTYDTYYNTLIVGNDADNEIHGADSTTHYGALADVVYAGLGDDTVWGRGGDDTLYGEDGKDVLFGGEGSDYLSGGDGNDLLFSGRLYDGSSDTLIGGAGADTFVLGEYYSETTPVSFDWQALALSLAGDVSDFSITATAPTFGMKLVKEVVPVTFDIAKAIMNMEGGDEIAPPEAAYSVVDDFNPLEDVVILPINGEGAANVFLSYDTNLDNVLTVKYDNGTSDDIVATINLAEASEIFGDDVTTMSETAKQAFIDALMATAIVVNGDGATYGLNNGTEIDSDFDFSSLGDNGYIMLGAYAGMDLEGDSSADYLFGTNYGDVISGYELDATSGTAFAPENAGNDELRGFGGDDLFYGGGGNDYIFGGEGSDTSAYVDAAAAISVDLSATHEDANGTYAEAEDGFGTTDKLYSIENIIGSDFDDTIVGDDGDNTLIGRDGANLVDGGGGNDSLYGGSGDETISGGAGDDYVEVTGGANVLDGGDGTDVLDLSRYTDGVTFDGTGETFTDASGLTSEVANFEFITGTGYDDVITGAGSEDLEIHGGAGDDVVTGGSGNDLLFGEAGNDVLFGGAGDDTLYATAGADTLAGGEGADTFVIASADAVITDFDAEEDTLMIDASAFGIDATGTATLNDLVYYQDEDNDVHFVTYGRPMTEIVELEGVTDQPITIVDEYHTVFDLALLV